MAYRVAIVGAGRIGAFLDDPESSHVLTHAHAYLTCGGFNIVGFVDTDLSRAEAASARWGGRAYMSIEELFKSETIEGVSICLPDQLHYGALMTLAEKPLKFIFLEKPAVRTLQEADEVRIRYGELSTRVLVNYTRRFLPQIRLVAAAARNGDYGAFLTGTGYYGKGLLHNGSHMVDLLHFLVGEVHEVAKIDQTVDFYADDPSVSALLSIRGGGQFYLRHISCQKFELFELDLLFEKKRIRLCELGGLIEEYSVGENSIFKGYCTLNKDAEYATQHSRAIYHAIANMRANLDRDEPLVCPLDESLDTAKTCSRILCAESR
jgi:predicted dehydrogenase